MMMIVVFLLCSTVHCIKSDFIRLFNLVLFAVSA